MKIRLNESNIAKLPPVAPGRTQDIYYDNKQTGFGIRVMVASKVFFVEGRVNGKTRRVSIGEWGLMSTEEARDKAKKYAGQMAEGLDPNKVKAEGKIKGNTLGEIFEHYKSSKTLTRNTIKVYDAAFRFGLSDWINQPIIEIDKDMVAQRYKLLKEKKTKRDTKGVAQTSQAMRLLSALFESHMQNEGKMFYNPVQYLSFIEPGWSKSKRRQGVISDKELPAFYTAVQLLKRQTARDFLLFLLLTGLRLNEALGLRWDEVDLTNENLIIPGSRTKNKEEHGLPLTNQLLMMLRRRSEDNTAVSIYVFPGYGKNKEGHYVEPKAAYLKVSERIGKRFSPHDLRRTFITTAEKLKIEPYSLKSLLNHRTSSDVTSGYIITELDRLKEPMQRINDQILLLMCEEPAPEPESDQNVVSINKARSSRSRRTKTK